MKIAVIIPTYNEKENIGRMIKVVFSLNISGLEIVIVDDNSPDGTGQLVEALKNKDARIHPIHRQKKEGLGPAYITGFRYALGRGAEYIFEMDADFSHNPQKIPEFLEAVQEADLVLGSRYIPGGKMAVEWWRRVVSRMGSLYAQIILGLPVRDVTGGFKCFRRKVLASLDLNKVRATNYSFQIELTYKAFKKGFRIKEIPIIFTEREGGKSKFYFKMIFEAFCTVLGLRFRKNL